MTDPLLELFRNDLESQAKNLSQCLIELEKKPHDPALLETSMRAAHSIKGAAKVISLDLIVRLAHAMEDCFVSAQKGDIEIDEKRVDLLLKGVDFFTALVKVKGDEMEKWSSQMLPSIENLIGELTGKSKTFKEVSFQVSYPQEKVLRMTAENLNRLMGLAGESMVEARWLTPFGDNLQKFKNNIRQLSFTLDALKNDLNEENLNEAAQTNLKSLQLQIKTIYDQFKKHLGDLANFIGRYSTLSERLYQEVVSSRMRPFSDGVEVFPRIVRDLGRELGKQVRLEIIGQATLVDREILEKLESPLTHLLRNAVSHGIETPEVRKASGKSPEGVIKLEARHQGGLLSITVSDDGRGLDIGLLRKLIVEKKYLTQEMASNLTVPEVIDFLFLPGFSTSKDLSDISGRGVGLNVVQSTVKEIGGRIHTSFIEGKGTTFNLLLPITLSVIRALLVEIDEEIYALPLSRIDHSIVLEQDEIHNAQDSLSFHYADEEIPLVPAWQVLNLKEPTFNPSHYSIILISDREKKYGFAIDRLLGEKELVVHELDSRLGKVPDILAASVLEDGSPVLILDVEDLVHSIKNLLQKKTKPFHIQHTSTKRILIIDDSSTVREFESRLLKNQGYEVETAENGMAGLNTLKLHPFDLVITDLDMPRMDGIALLKEIRKDSKLTTLPVIVVTYKSTDEEQQKGLEAGASAYLSKNSFHDDTMIKTVSELIG